MVEERWSFVHKSGKGSRGSGDKEHDRSSAGEERYGICAGCEGSERDGMRPLRPSY